MPLSVKLQVLDLLTGQKSGFSPRTDSVQTWQGRRTSGSAWPCKISPQSAQRGGNAAPKISKISTFLVKSRPAEATPLTDLENFYALLYAYLSYISVSNFT